MYAFLHLKHNLQPNFSLKSYLRLSWSACGYNDFTGNFLFLHANGLFYGNFVKRVHGVLNSVGDNAELIRLNSDLDGIINDSFDTDENSEAHGDKR